MSQHVMIDLETLGTSRNAAIISIGAVKFDINIDGDFRPFSQFHVAIDPRSAVRHGFVIEPETVIWWMSEDRAKARKALLENLERSLDLPSAIDGFAQWYLSDEDPEKLPCVWGNGSMFDNILMLAAFDRVGEDCPWSYKSDMCYRTFRKLDPTYALAPPAVMEHDALADALYQAEHLHNICRHMRIAI